jgi:hypothetical protein
MSLHFINSETGWVATLFDGIMKSTNGGTNWFTDSSPINDNYFDVFFIDNETGWIAGGYNSIYSGGTVLTTGNFPIGIGKVNSNFPEIFSLSQNYPNPFNPVTKIKYSLPNPSPANSGINSRGALQVKLIIYDILGREIQTLVNENKKPGTYEVDWDGSRFASGVYFYRLVTDDPSTSSEQGFVETKKMVLVK